MAVPGPNQCFEPPVKWDDCEDDDGGGEIDDTAAADHDYYECADGDGADDDGANDDGQDDDVHDNDGAYDDGQDDDGDDDDGANDDGQDNDGDDDDGADDGDFRFAIDGLTEKLHMFPCRKESETLAIIKKHLPFVCISLLPLWLHCLKLVFIQFQQFSIWIWQPIHNFLLPSWFKKRKIFLRSSCVRRREGWLACSTALSSQKALKSKFSIVFVFDNMI